MSRYVSHPHLDTQERQAWDAWRIVLKARLKKWGNTEAYRMLDALDIEGRWPFYGLRRAYSFGDIDGTLEALERIVSGEIYVTNFGDTSRMRLAAALIRWYKRER